jgi:hypothetical protein
MALSLPVFRPVSTDARRSVTGDHLTALPPKFHNSHFWFIMFDVRIQCLPDVGTSLLL